MAIIKTSSPNKRSDSHYVLTDTGYREKEPWLNDVNDHVAAFLAKGGKIQQIEPCVTAYDVRKQTPFIINRNHHEKP